MLSSPPSPEILEFSIRGVFPPRSDFPSPPDKWQLHGVLPCSWAQGPKSQPRIRSGTGAAAPFLDYCGVQSTENDGKIGKGGNEREEKALAQEISHRNQFLPPSCSLFCCCSQESFGVCFKCSRLGVEREIYLFLFILFLFIRLNHNLKF